MCQTYYWRSRECGHEWFELIRRCGPKMNLLTCPDFHPSQPFGNIEKPLRSRWAPPYECPRRDDEGDYDMRRRRMMITKRTGWRVGVGPSRRDLGVDVYPRAVTGCCSVM